MNKAKEQILNVALGLFLRDSFKGVTLSQIVKKTGISKGAFFHYLESKEQLFFEILNSYFFDSMVIDYSKFSGDSLYQFSRDYLDELRKRIPSPEKKIKISLRNTNYFFLIFEGLKLFPAFRRKFSESQDVELRAWKNIAGIARKKGEISSDMTDDQIANLFISVTDAVGIRVVMENAIDKMEEEILELWDGLYHQLKA